MNDRKGPSVTLDSAAEHASLSGALVTLDRAAASTGLPSNASLAPADPPLSPMSETYEANSVPSVAVAYREQYRRAIAMTSPQLGAAIKKPTERITKQICQAIRLEGEARAATRVAQAEFRANVALFYEAKQRLLNPGYRADIDGGKKRTPEDNLENFGAPDWATFNAMCNAYTLQHADRLLKQFAKANGLLTDVGEDIDDPDSGDAEQTGSRRRSTVDITALKRYEHIATAAMAIASRNPEGEVEKQILAAAEFVPTPVTPLQPDIFTEVVNFVTPISKQAPTESLQADAKKLLAKLLLFRPASVSSKVMAESPAEEKRKRGGRLAKKNGRPLRTSEHLQQLQMVPQVNPQTETVQERRARKRLNLFELDAEDISNGFVGDQLLQTQLEPGKKYQVRPAPSGGYGVYQLGSTILLQWYGEEDDARDAISSVMPLAVV